MKKHYTIPFFIPHEGCPFACIFCKQDKISGRKSSVDPKEIAPTITKYLKTIPAKESQREVAFFGGSFTGLTKEKQESYLKETVPFIKKGLIHSVRLSTRPDFIDQNILDMLKKYNVSSIELGVQSMFQDVLKSAKRGHTKKDVKKASRLIVENDFELGHQIMVGLPKSTLRKELKTAKMSIQMKASQVRIYPAIVIKCTELASMWEKGSYKALTEEEAIKRCAKLVTLFEKNKVKILRCGLHPSTDLITRKDVLSGPFHEAFGQKVRSYIYGARIKRFLKKSLRHITFNPSETAYVIGYKRENANDVEPVIKEHNIFISSEKVSPGTIVFEYENGTKKTINIVG